MCCFTVMSGVQQQFVTYWFTSHDIPNRCYVISKKRKKGKRQVQGVPQSQTAAFPRPQEEEETEKSKQAQTEQTYEKQAGSNTWKLGITSVEVWHSLKHYKNVKFNCEERRPWLPSMLVSSCLFCKRRAKTIYDLRISRLRWVLAVGIKCLQLLCSRIMAAYMSSVGKCRLTSNCTSTVYFLLRRLVPRRTFASSFLSHSCRESTLF